MYSNYFDMDKESRIEDQISLFKKGKTHVKLVRPATVNDGIEQIDPDEQQQLTDYYDRARKELTVSKFIPASGAATRMFKELFEYINTGTETANIKKFKKDIELFAFAPILEDTLKRSGCQDPLKTADTHTLAETLLDQSGLRYANLPKGLIDFHKYGNESRKAVDEHLAEAAHYAADGNNRCNIHLTVSQSHEPLFRSHLNDIKRNFESRLKVRYNFDFSTQSKDTDTVAVDQNLKPITTERGNTLTRPGGHGALINNLHYLSEDIIFIKNIDNVVPETRLQTTVKWKKILGGKLLEVKSSIFDLLNQLKSGNAGSDLTEKAIKILNETFHVQLAENTSKEDVIKLLDRPIRVCGMVKNTGKPGGGPFFVKDNDGRETLQIVEKPEVDDGDDEQLKIADRATHFNPVDIVCCIKNHKGERFNLERFKNNERYFISEKSYRGEKIFALEHPGLWNGGMHDWLTVFVEVPLETFNPVKTVFDLLKEEHKE